MAFQTGAKAVESKTAIFCTSTLHSSMDCVNVCSSGEPCGARTLAVMFAQPGGSDDET